MKKLFLLLAVGSIAMNVGAQERQMPIIQGPGTPIQNGHQVDNAALRSNMDRIATSGRSKASRTTAVSSTSRWYDYNVYQNLLLTSDMALGIGGSDYLFTYGDVMWKDTLTFEYFSSGPGRVNLTTMGMVIQPQAPGFNRVDLWDPYYGGTSHGTYINVSATDAYSIDSVVIPNDYFPGSKASTVADTLRVCFLYGNGGATSDIFSGAISLNATSHYGAQPLIDVAWDSLTNTAVAITGGATAYYMDIIIHPTDTNSLTDNVTSYAIVQTASGGGMANKGSINFDGTLISGSSAMPFTVPAGNMVSVTYTFISGDVATHSGGKLASLPGDTLLAAVAPYSRYNNFRGFVGYWEPSVNPASFTGGSLPTPDYPDFVAPTDENEGIFNSDYATNLRLGTGLYGFSPQWGYTASTGGAYYWQYPEISVHIVCPTCRGSLDAPATVATVNSVTAVPNPATDELNIKFSLTQASDITVSLTNMLGQVVATQNISNTASGKAVFNTVALPAGIYVYTLQANGSITTGRVVVAK